MKNRWRRVGVHNWACGCKIYESHKEDENGFFVRFTATILGWKNWKLYEGKIYVGLPQDVLNKVIEIRDRIENGDEAVFEENCEIKKEIFKV